MTRESDEANAAFIERYDPLIERRARREPVAYIRGVQEFWSRDYAVNTAVLIPRPETELIIEELLELPAEGSATARVPRRADIGTGSGCIAVTAAAERPHRRGDRDRYFAAGPGRGARQCRSATASPTASRSSKSAYVGRRRADRSISSCRIRRT